MPDDLHVASVHDKCGSGPVITEYTGKGSRAICCFCWAHTRTRETRIDAAAAWNAGQITEHHPHRRKHA